MMFAGVSTNATFERKYIAVLKSRFYARNLIGRAKKEKTVAVRKTAI